MCEILLSINPEHIENIFNGTKKYEYRKIKCKERVTRIIMYSTAPVMRIVGEADVEEILDDMPELVWKETKEYSGIEYSFFQKYYNGKSRAIAYKLCNVKKYKQEESLKDYGLSFAPQSFVYLERT